MRSFDKDSMPIDTIDNKVLSEPLLKFTRLEKKCLIDSKTAELLMGHVGMYLPLDNRTVKSPHISSIYLDNWEWKCYNEQMRKVNPRFKIRFRRYQQGDNLSDKGFLEIKRKANSISSKDRFNINIRQLDSLSDIFISNETAMQNAGLGRDHLGETYYKITRLIKKFRLCPVAKVDYFRTAFENAERTLRVTFDSYLEFHALNNKYNTAYAESHKMPDDFMVMEIKFAGRAPEWLISLIKYTGTSKQRFSKYCTAIRYLYLPEDLTVRPNSSFDYMNKYGLTSNGNSESIIFNTAKF
jgi:hypothetical protein